MGEGECSMAWHPKWICATGPGGDGVQGFWNKASQNADLPSLIPHERWAIEAAYAPEVAVNKMYVRFAGLLPSVEAFDAGAFRSVCLTNCPLPQEDGVDCMHTVLIRPNLFNSRG